jgi:hypothetical protein
MEREFHRLCSVWWVSHISNYGMDIANQEINAGSARYTLERALNFYAAYTWRVGYVVVGNTIALLGVSRVNRK